MIELGRCHLHGLLDLTSIGETLSGEGITAEEPPPTLLHIEPTRPFGNKDVLQAWMFHSPGARLQAVMTAEIIGDHKDVTPRIVGLNVLEQLNGVLGIPRGSTARDFLAIADPQRSIDPHLVIPTTVLQRRLDAMTIR
jgi:hypothetical protein